MTTPDPFTALLNWLAQSILPIAVGIGFGILIEVFLREFIFEQFLSPSIRHKAKMLKKKFSKKIRNPHFDMSYSSNSVGLELKNIEKSKIKEIIQFLRDKNINCTDKGDIFIDEYRYNEMIFNGTIEFSTTNKKDIHIIEGFSIDLKTKIKYNSMESDIATLIQGVSKLKEFVGLALGVPIESRDTMSCTLNKLMVELTEAMKDLDITYIKFGGKADVAITKDKVVFREPIIPSVVFPNLKKLVTLYLES